jgi:hypothetical protein
VLGGATLSKVHCADVQDFVDRDIDPSAIATR